MNKQEVIDSIAEKSGLTKTDCKKVLDAFQTTVQDSVKKGNGVVLVGFMTFAIKRRQSRNSINPITRAPMVIPEKDVLTIKPGKDLTDQIAPVKAAAKPAKAKK
jgi:DNA-binding protein HU-beta